jgi:hypothetical protein
VISSTSKNKKYSTLPLSTPVRCLDWGQKLPIPKCHGKTNPTQKLLLKLDPLKLGHAVTTAPNL